MAMPKIGWERTPGETRRMARSLRRAVTVWPSSFAGTAPQVAVPPDPGWAFGDQEFTIALWAKFPTADVRQALLLFGRDGIKRPVDRHDWGWGPALALGPRHLVRRSRAIPAATAPTWHHLGVSRGGSTFRFYVDGEELAVQEAATAPAPRKGTLTIGGAEGWAQFQGLLDDLRIYHRALSATEIKSVADAFWTTGTLSATARSLTIS